VNNDILKKNVHGTILMLNNKIKQSKKLCLFLRDSGFVQPAFAPDRRTGAAFVMFLSFRCSF